MHRGLGMTIVLLALVASPVAAATAAAVVLPSFDATRLYSAETFAAAIKPYQDAIARNANDPDAHFWLGIAYLRGWQLHKFGLAPFAAGYAGRAVASLERAVQLRATPEAMVALLEAYAYAGDRSKYNALFERVGDLAQPAPLK